VNSTAATFAVGWGIKAASTTSGALANPLKGIKYTDKVLKQISNTDDLYHAFPSQIDDLARMSDVSKIKGADGVVRDLVKMPGSINGKSGTFQYIIEADRTVNHRLFVPD